MRDRRSKRDWRAHLLPEEKRMLKAIEKDLAAMDKSRMVLKAERDRIQNRATVRAGK